MAKKLRGSPTIDVEYRKKETDEGEQELYEVVTSKGTKTLMSLTKADAARMGLTKKSEDDEAPAKRKPGRPRKTESKE